MVFTAVPTSRDRQGYSVFAVDATVDWVLKFIMAVDQATGVVQWKYGFESDQVSSPDGTVIALLCIGQADRTGQHVVALSNSTSKAA